MRERDRCWAVVLPLAGLVLACALLACGLLACSSPRLKPDVDANSHWLEICEVSADCKGEGACICGLCTRTCSNDGECADSAGDGAVCVRPSGASDDVVCAAVVEAASERICLARCEQDDDCGNRDLRCVEHACWAQPKGLIDMRDAGAGAGSAGAPSVLTEVPPRPGIDASIDLDTLEVSTDFSEPTPKPMASDEISGDVAALVGIWQAEPAPIGMWHDPLRLDITQAAREGAYVGTVTYMCSDGICDPLGPPPPVTDGAAYPPDLDAHELYDLSYNGMARAPYPMLDARFENGRFTFWYSQSDLWRDWCPLQTSHRFEVGARHGYSCVADPQPCEDLVLRPAAEVDPLAMLCCRDGDAPCSCDADGCRATRGVTARFDFTVEGDTMTGLWAGSADTVLNVLHRVQVVAP